MRKLGTFLAGILMIGTLSSFDTVDKTERKIKKPTNLNVNKTVTSFETGTETLYKVQVKINNASSIKGFAKYEDLIPAGFTVTGMFSDFGNATFDSEKAEVTFISLNQRDEVTITYYLQGELQFKPSSVSTFSYVSGEEMSRLKITE